MNLSLVRNRLIQREYGQYIVRMFWLATGIGILLRVVQYFADRSLWLDEAYLALNISHRSFEALLQPLDYGQAAPVGFLFLEKLCINGFGNTDYVLRIVPLLSSIASLFLFRELATLYVRKRAALIALTLFAISSSLIYYASELKQYSSDVTVTLVLLLLATMIYDKGITVGRVALFSAAGALAVWFSYPAAFVLTGLGVVLFVRYAVRRDWASMFKLAIIGAIWAASFTIYFVVSLGTLSQSEYLRSFWNDRNAFMPLPPTSFSDLKWFCTTFFTLFKDRTQLPFESIAALVFLVGLVALMRREWLKYCLLLSPIAITFFVSGLEKYTISERTTLFFIPILFVFAGAGAVYIYDSLKTQSSLIANGFLIFFFIPLTFDASVHMLKPVEKEEIKPVMAYLQSHMQPGDTIYVYYSAQYAFKYYQQHYGFSDGDYIAGKDPRDFISAEKRDDLQRYITELNQLDHKSRVWIVFAHSYDRTGIDEEAFFLYHLDTLGKQLDRFKQEGSAIYLYDLR